MGSRRPVALFALIFALAAISACADDPSSSLRGDVASRTLDENDQGFRPNSLSHRIYAEKPSINLLGTGFEKFKRTEIHLTLEINGITLEQFEDFNLNIQSDERIRLELNEGKSWWGSSKKAGALILKKAVFDASTQTDGHTGGAYEYKLRVATIIPTPTAVENKKLEILRTQTVRLPINGTGFDSKAKIDVFFEPEVDQSKLEVLAHSETVLYVRLLAGGAWRSDEGPLFLKSINTGGGPRKINGDDGIQIAKVVKNHAGKVVESKARLYQSTQKMSIWGEDFSETTIIRFASGLAKNTNYTQKFADLGKNKFRLDLELKKGSKWRALPGQMKAMAMLKGEGYSALPLSSGASKGIVVAEVLADPKVTENKENIDRTHGELLIIKGSGFSRSELGATKVTFDPELEMGFDYDMSVKDTKTMHLTLKTDRAWRPDAGPLKVTKIDTGAGEFNVDVIVGMVQNDVEDHSSGVVVISSPDQAFYQSQGGDKCLQIRGTKLTKDAKLEFNSKISPNMYKQEYRSETELCLTLNSGEKWADGASSLKVLSVTIGGKKIPIGREKNGVAVAKIYIDPQINPAPSKDTYQSFTKRITIRGSGFDKDYTELAFTPPLTPRDASSPEYGEYEYVDVQPTYIVVGLVNNARWIRANLEPGDRVELSVHSVTTAAGSKVMSPAITVATVTHDPEHVLCTDTCPFSNDDYCDDIPRDAASYYSDDEMYDLDDEYFEPYDMYNYEDDEYGYAFMYDDDYQLYDDDEWYALDDNSVVCDWGTDCSDCGPREEVENPECTNTCQFARDGWCDDERTAMICKLGTDCQDCGPVGASNFTDEDHDNDDGEYWEPFPYLDDDDDMIEWKNDPRANRGTVQHHGAPDAPGPGTLLVDVLMGLVYFVGAVVLASGFMFAYKLYKGEAIPYHLLSLDPEQPSTAPSTVELQGFEMQQKTQARQY